MGKIIPRLLTLSFFLSLAPNVYANMALPPSYYYGSSVFLLLTMVISDAIALWLALKLVRVKINKVKFFIALITTVILGIIADISSLIITNTLLNTFFPLFSRYHQGFLRKVDYLLLFSPSSFYMLGVSLNNFTSHFPEYVPPLGVSLLMISAFICIACFNLIHKAIFKISAKQAFLTALLLGIFTNPGWGLYPYAFIAWIIILGIIFIFIKKNKL